jgi:hypothetical protein
MARSYDRSRVHPTASFHNTAYSTTSDAVSTQSGFTFPLCTNVNRECYERHRWTPCNHRWNARNRSVGFNELGNDTGDATLELLGLVH